MSAAILAVLLGALALPPDRTEDARSADAVTAHRFHVSLAQADYNPKTGSLEVALRVNPFDLEDALTRAHGSKVDLDRTPDVDEHIVRYLRERFTLTSPDGERARFEWVGKEDFTLEMWLYFELRVDAPAGSRPKDLAGHTVSNRLFFELHPEQTNSVTYGRGKSRKSLRFTSAQRSAEL